MGNRESRILMPLLIVIVAIFFEIYLLWAASHSLPSVSDLPEYFTAAKLALEGHGNQIFDLSVISAKENQLFPNLHGRSIGFMLPPLAIPYLIPLALVDTDLASILWKGLNILALFGSLLLLKRELKLKVKSWLWLCAGVFLSGPVYEALRIDQPSPLLLLALCVTIWATRSGHSLWAGLALSVFWLKPQQIAAFLIVMLATKRYKELVYFLIFSLILAVISFGLLTGPGLMNYLMVFSPTADLFMQSNLGPTVRGQLLRLFPSNRIVVMIASLFALLLSLVVTFIEVCRFTRGRDQFDSDRFYLGILVAMPLGLLTSLHCHDYDLVLLIPSIALLLMFADRIKHLRWLLFACTIPAILISIPFYVEIHYRFLLNAFPINPIFWLLMGFSASIFAIVRANYQQLTHERS